MDLELLILDRLKFGKKRYGHGVRVDDDTTQFGTPSNSWMHMALEEHLDAVIYIIADYIKKKDFSRPRDEDDNQRIIYFIMNPEQVYGSHKSMLDCLTKLINLAFSESETADDVSIQLTPEIEHNKGL